LTMFAVVVNERAGTGSAIQICRRRFG
jgi:hypothetical protein